jgi:hypothetical protein
MSNLNFRCGRTRADFDGRDAPARVFYGRAAGTVRGRHLFNLQVNSANRSHHHACLFD